MGVGGGLYYCYPVAEPAELVEVFPVAMEVVEMIVAALNGHQSHQKTEGCFSKVAADAGLLRDY